jgi:predicted membrane-bound spermidine synthase
MRERAQRLFLALIFGSGFCGLIYEVVFTKLLTYVFGVTAYAVSTVLAAFMGGLALGSWLLGKRADRVRRPLRLYAVLELLIGLYCVWTPKLYPLLDGLYRVLYQRFGLSAAMVTVVRYGLCWGFILVPTVLMGGTLPAAAKWLARREEEIAPRVSVLYAVNTLGAAVGTLAATYVLLFHLGLDGAIYFAAVLNAFIFAGAWLLDRGEFADETATVSTEETAAPAALKPPRPLGPVVVRVAALATGAISLGYEAVWTHLLAQTIGNSVTAFGLMLFSFLVGIGLGSLLLARLRPDAGRAASWAAASQFLAGLAVLAVLPLWDKIPLVFLLGRPYRSWSALLVFVPVGLLLLALPLLRGHRSGPPRRSIRIARLALRVFLVVCIGALWSMRHWIESSATFESVLFWGAELGRFVCSVNMLIWPTLFLGATFPLLIRAHAEGVRNLGERVGGVYFWNTAGAIFGSLAAAFCPIPWLGSAASLKVLAWSNWAVGLALVSAIVHLGTRRKWVWSGVCTAAMLGLTVIMPPWNLRALNSGANVYFDADPIDEILFYAEDAQGGVTSVVREGDTRVSLTNGKFEGNDGTEMATQDAFAHVPLALYTPLRSRAGHRSGHGSHAGHGGTVPFFGNRRGGVVAEHRDGCPQLFRAYQWSRAE